MSRTLLIFVALVSSIGFLFVESAFPDDAVGELKRRNPHDPVAIQKTLDGLKGLKADSIGVELYELRKLHDISKENWAKLDKIRAADNSKSDKEVEKLGINYAANNWKNLLTKNAKLLSSKEREAKAYEARYKEPFGPYASKASEWAKSDEAKAFEAEREKAKADYDRANKANADKATSGNTALDKELDDLQKSLLADFQLTSDAVRKAQNAFDDQTAKESAKTTPPPTAPLPTTPQTGTVTPKPSVGDYQGQPHNNLTFHFNENHWPLRDITLDQTLELDIIYGNGHGPFHMVVRSSDGTMSVYNFTDPGEVTIPIRFKTSLDVPQTVVLTLNDANGTTEKLEHRVIVHPGAMNVVTPKIKNQPPPPIVVVTPKIVNQQLLTPIVGTYRAILVIGYEAGLRPGFPFVKKSLPILDTPIRITFEPSGVITGVCDLTFPDSGFGPKSQISFDRVGWKTKFTIRGNVDWKTGKMELTIPDGRIDYFFVSGQDRQDYVIEYGATFRGRHVTDPFWDVFSRYYFLKNTAPKIVTISEAGSIVGDDGETHDIWGHRIGQTPDPGIITKEIDWKKRTHIIKSLNLTRDEKLDTEREQNAYAVKHGGGGWTLKLIGPDTTASDLANSELVATSLWPERVTTAAVGETVFSKFVGVFSDDYTKFRELNDLATWQVPTGLTQISPGVFRADRPGTYDVSVKAKGKSGAWMEGFLTINVTGL